MVICPAMVAFGKQRGGLAGRHGQTVTWELARPCSTPTDDPVRTLRLIPEDRIYRLDDYRWEGRPRRWVSIGKDPDSAIHIQDDTVSDEHCSLFRDRKTGRLYVEDCRSKNGVRVNDVLVFDGRVELASGSLLSLGATILMACGRAGDAQRPVVSGVTLHEILERAIAVYGTQNCAADSLKIKRATFSRWLTTQRFL